MNSAKSYDMYNYLGIEIRLEALMVAARSLHDMRVIINHPLNSDSDDTENGVCAGTTSSANINTSVSSSVSRGPLNLGFIHANLLAGDLQSILHDITAAGAVIQCVAVQFPDPHWKGKNRKRRILTPSLLRTAGVYLRPGGIFYLQSDVRDVVADVQRDVTSQSTNLLVMYNNVITSLPEVVSNTQHKSEECTATDGKFHVVQVFGSGEGDEASDCGLMVDDISVEDVVPEDNLVEQVIAATAIGAATVTATAKTPAHTVYSAPPEVASSSEQDSPSYRVMRVYSDEDQVDDDPSCDIRVADVVPETGAIDADCVCIYGPGAASSTGNSCCCGRSLSQSMFAGAIPKEKLDHAASASDLVTAAAAEDSPTSYRVVRVYSNEDEASDCGLTVDDIAADDVVPEELDTSSAVNTGIDVDIDSNFLLSVFSNFHGTRGIGAEEGGGDGTSAADSGQLLRPDTLLKMQKIEHVDSKCISMYVPRCFTDVQTERSIYVTRKNKAIHHIVLRMNDVALAKRSVMNDIKSRLS